MIIKNIMAPPVSVKPCAKCGKEAMQHCEACAGGIDALGMIVEKKMYCSDACQQSAWKNHKQSCKKFSARKQIYRAGELVQDAFLGYREKAFDLKIIKVEKKGEDLYVYEGPYGLAELLLPFPIDKIDNDEDKKMLLAWYSCSDVVGYMHKLVKDLLHGIILRPETRGSY